MLFTFNFMRLFRAFSAVLLYRQQPSHIGGYRPGLLGLRPDKQEILYENYARLFTAKESML